MNVVAWGSAVVVLGGVLTAWMDPSTGGLLHAAVFTLAAATAVYVAVKRIGLPVHWLPSCRRILRRREFFVYALALFTFSVLALVMTRERDE
jgi:hypothetical protein